MTGAQGTEGPASAPDIPNLPALSIVTATLNERANLSILLERIQQLDLPPYEIIVVDDGSSDGTREVLLQAAENDPRIRPLFHEGRQTLIPAHCQGIRASKGKSVIIMDADLQHPPEVLPLMARKLENGTDLVVASRYADGGSPGDCSLGRMYISLGAQLVTKLFVSHARKISDPISGFYGFHRKIFVPVDPRWRGYELLPFILVMSRGVSVSEVPYVFEPRKRGVSKIIGKDFGFVRTFLTEIVLVSRFARSHLILPEPLRSIPQSDAGASHAGIQTNRL